MPAKELTREQQADARRLKEIVAKEKAKRPYLSQDHIAEACGWKTQGAVSQYLNGKIPLNAAAAIRFAKVLQCRVEDFSPAIAREIDELSQSRAATVLEDRRAPEKAWPVTQEALASRLAAMLLSEQDVSVIHRLLDLIDLERRRDHYSGQPSDFIGRRFVLQEPEYKSLAEQALLADGPQEKKTG